MTGHELSTLTGAYALDALDDVERDRFEAHLASCPECAAEVASLRAAAAELSHASAVEPPAGLRADVLSAARQIRPHPPAMGVVTDLARRRRSGWLWPAAAAACAVLAVAAAAWGYQQHRAADQAAHRNAQAAAIATLLDTQGSGSVSGTIGSTGHVTAVYSHSRNKVIVIGSHLPAPGAGKTYQLWLMDAQGKATSAGVFAPNSHGDVLVRAAGNLASVAAMGISIEPDGGSAQPTTAAIVAVMKI